MVVEHPAEKGLSIAIMQPYFLPYLGYFQLLEAVDIFVLYDNIQYTKKGWINRNRLLQNTKSSGFSIPIKKGSDYLNVCDRSIATAFNPRKLLNQISGAYKRSPYFEETYPLIKEIVFEKEENLFLYIHNSILKVCDHLGLNTKIKISSNISIDHGLKNQEKVLSFCKEEQASKYVNPIGGRDLYARERFEKDGIALKFLDPTPLVYSQFGDSFVPNLSILDVMMFNSTSSVLSHIKSGFHLVQG